jgi:hypothetical protein
MKALILLGCRKGSNVPETLYTGLDGEELQKIAQAACWSGKWATLGKSVNPGLIPLPTEPVGAHAPAPKPEPVPTKKAK